MKWLHFFPWSFMGFGKLITCLAQLLFTVKPF